MSRTKPKPKIKTIPWDPAANLKTDADIAHYLEAVFEDGDPTLVAAALGDVSSTRTVGWLSPLLRSYTELPRTDQPIFPISTRDCRSKSCSCRRSSRASRV